MDVLLVASAFNSLSQRVYAELSDRGHHVDVVLAARGDAHGDTAVREAVREGRPDLVLAPMLRTALPEDVWSSRTCLIVHPGPPGDRGPSALDWAIAEGATRWAVTVLQAEAELDAGDIWASVPFDVPPVGKSDLYRNEASDAAMAAVLLAVERFGSGSFKPRPQHDPSVGVVRRGACRQEHRRVDWRRDTTEAVLGRLRGADSRPGVLDELCGEEFFLHGGHPEDELRGRPGELLATRTGAVCRATLDGAVWIPELRPRRRPGGPATYRLPAAAVLGGRLAGVPEEPAPLELPERRRTWADIRYAQRGDVGLLRFGFPGGAMSTDHCRRLLAAYRYALTRPTRVLVLGGTRDFFSNGIHLNVIEAAADPAAESWANINAMDDLVEAVLRTTDRLVVAALAGNAAAGGAMLALAADEVWCRAGAVLNPHYRRMGLYGSEFWTYTLPRRAGTEAAEELMARALPVSTAAGARAGLVDRVLPVSPPNFAATVERMAAESAHAPDLARRVAAKRAALERDEAARPLADHRRAELAAMHRIFFDPRAPYHRLRTAFVHKTGEGSARPLLPPPGLDLATTP
ncbi:enoyl-CoA hydratase-related protein [Streptomyces sp. NRRL F-5135]|uniref:enoyl-CoA hydratase-related protein n=1 Tax=Streptomyces sp. NRRL F-5135 TaxID=1463858 RepID=UPI0004C6925B|nr:enoyl-CoA hydratase-related protein [Streptomyces sp. NRRL F-5135]